MYCDYFSRLYNLPSFQIFIKVSLFSVGYGSYQGGGCLDRTHRHVAEIYVIIFRTKYCASNIWPKWNLTKIHNQGFNCGLFIIPFFKENLFFLHKTPPENILSLKQLLFVFLSYIQISLILWNTHMHSENKPHLEVSIFSPRGMWNIKTRSDYI